MSEYPCPEHVVKREIVFTERASEEVVNGKAYWPIILQLTIDRRTLVRIIKEGISTIAYPDDPDSKADTFEFYIFGDITEEREG